ncbi:MAG: diguanylate cyclase, partial [Deltaproteobacteria bacterium]|nr:diguanylate cyclase [Deltaproteobacteria bacterium]
GKDLLPGEREADGTPKGLLFSCVRCLQGVGDSVIDAVKGVAYFLKLLAVEAPKFVWDKSKQAWHAASDWIARQWDDAPDPVSGAVAASDANADAHSGLINAAKEYWQAFKDFVKSIGHKIDEEWQEFKCLPASLQSQILCKMVMDVFMLVVTPDKILKGVKWGSQLTAAMSKTLQAIRASNLLKEGALAAGIERIGVAIAAGAEVMKSGSILRRFGDSRLMEYVNAAGQKILRFEKRINGQWLAREVMLDADTGTILRTTEQGADLLKTMVAHAAGEAGKTSSAVAMIDVNYLGKVNYFKESAIAGDKYLKAVSKAIKGAVREDDLIFRYGGDEFLLQLEKVSPQEAKNIMSKINKAVADSPEAREIFNAQRKVMAEQYRAVNKAGSLAELAPEYAKDLSDDARKLAEADFGKFKSQFLAAQEAAIKDMSKIRPTVSVGGTMLKEGDDVSQVVSRASEEVGKVKGAYKKALGMDASKYGGGAGDAATLGPKPTMPEVRMPE